MDLHQRSFRAIGCAHTVIATEGAAIEAAAMIAEALLRDLDLAASRFRADSEVSRLADRARLEDLDAVVSPLLGSCLVAALHAAAITDGLVDPTVGAALVAAGYDKDLDLVRGRGDVSDACGQTAPSPDARVPGWQSVRYDPTTRVVSVRRGTLLDLGASAKAHAADLIAARLAAELPGGFLVNLGGDIAVSGLLPAQGWDIGVEDECGEVAQVVVSTGQAITSSSTRLRTWIRDGELRHHIIDPRTGRSTDPVWAQVSCAGATAVEANAASTAALVLGRDAPAWLEAHGIPARLEPPTGPTVTTTGWPSQQGMAA